MLRSFEAISSVMGGFAEVAAVDTVGVLTNSMIWAEAAVEATSRPYSDARQPQFFKVLKRRTKVSGGV
jgi:hypothetical protein